jgi:hypothetical protein
MCAKKNAGASDKAASTLKARLTRRCFCSAHQKQLQLTIIDIKKTYV